MVFRCCVCNNCCSGSKAKKIISLIRKLHWAVSGELAVYIKKLLPKCQCETLNLPFTSKSVQSLVLLWKQYFIARRLWSLLLVTFYAYKPYLHLYNPTYKVCSINISSSPKQHLDQVFILLSFWDLFGARKRITQWDSSSAYMIK